MSAAISTICMISIAQSIEGAAYNYINKSKQDNTK